MAGAAAPPGIVRAAPRSKSKPAKPAYDPDDLASLASVPSDDEMPPGMAKTAAGAASNNAQEEGGYGGYGSDDQISIASVSSARSVASAAGNRKTAADTHAASPAPARETSGMQAQQAREQSLADAMSQLAAQDSLPFNSVSCVLIGPGGAGKTATRRALQNLPFLAVRQSTCGGDRLDLTVVALSRQELVAFQESDATLTHSQQALLSALIRAKTDHPDQSLDALLQSAIDSFDNAGKVEEALRAFEASVVAFHSNGKVDQSQGNDDKSAAADPSGRAVTLRDSANFQQSSANADSSPARTQVDLAAAGITSEAAFMRDKEVVLSRAGDAAAAGVKATFYDMGGQPEFWALAAVFLRR